MTTNDPLRLLWRNMKARCLNPKHDRFHRYGGRGITVCDEWLDFAAFQSWAESTGYIPGLSIERENLDGDYEPSNCRWITKVEQYLNRADSHRESFDGETKTLKEWSQDPRCEVSFTTLRMRLYRGWTFESALASFREKACAECDQLFLPRASNNDFCSRKCVSDASNERVREQKYAS